MVPRNGHLTVDAVFISRTVLEEYLEVLEELPLQEAAERLLAREGEGWVALGMTAREFLDALKEAAPQESTLGAEVGSPLGFLFGQVSPEGIFQGAFVLLDWELPPVVASFELRSP